MEADHLHLRKPQEGGAAIEISPQENTMGFLYEWFLNWLMPRTID
jgi:hypothetical protein